MKVIEWIKEKGFQSLTDELGIVVKFVDDLVVLNYNQIDSPKTHPVVVECRSLILEKESLKVVSRSFERFFNLGEALDTTPAIDWSKAVVAEKVDGSLIKIYHHKGVWNVATRGTTYAEGECMGHGVTFCELVYKALGVKDKEEFQAKCEASLLDKRTTYIFELTCIENRVVKRYSGYTLHYLGARKNATGVYISEYEEDVVQVLGAKLINKYSFSSESDCIDSASVLKDLDEGYVVYQDGVPVCKIKSPAYVATHHIRGEGLNPKRAAELVLSGEVDEYLKYFPEDMDFIQPYIDTKNSIEAEMESVYNHTKWIEDQKEFAVKVKQYPFSAVLFKARLSASSVKKAFKSQSDSYKLKLILDTIGEEK